MRLFRLVWLAAAAGSATLPGPVLAHDYPTQARVVFVEQCMDENPGPFYEMVAKCSCALDRIAESTPYDDFVSMQTSTNASTIAGERGNAIRDAPMLQAEVKAYRELQDKAKKACFIGFMQQIR
jgi:hypothetical protein